MSNVNTRKCDFCGTLRLNDTNHWRTLRIDVSGVFYSGSLTDSPDTLPIGYTDQVDACGQQCALLGYASFLERGTFMKREAENAAKV